MENEERQRWLITAVVTVLAVVVLALFAALMLQTRVVDITGPALYRVREDMTIGAAWDLAWLSFFLGCTLLLMVGGGLMLLDDKERGWGFVMWAGSFLALYLVLTGTRDQLTLSEVQIRPAAQSASCAGYVLGTHYWTNTTLLSQVTSVEFPPSGMSADRYGMLVRVSQGDFCSLHNKTLTQAEAKTLAARLAVDLGARVKPPP